MTLRFKQIQVTSITDIVTGNLIPCLFAIETTGDIWRKISRQKWERITTLDHFAKHEDDINDKNA